MTSRRDELRDLKDVLKAVLARVNELTDPAMSDDSTLDLAEERRRDNPLLAAEPTEDVAESTDDPADPDAGALANEEIDVPPRSSKPAPVSEIEEEEVSSGMLQATNRLPPAFGPRPERGWRGQELPTVPPGPPPGPPPRSAYSAQLTQDVRFDHDPVSWLNAESDRDSRERRSRQTDDQPPYATATSQPPQPIAVAASPANTLQPGASARRFLSDEEQRRARFDEGPRFARMDSRFDRAWGEAADDSWERGHQYLTSRALDSLEKLMKPHRPEVFKGKGDIERFNTLDGPPQDRKTEEEVSADALAFLDEADAFIAMVMARTSGTASPSEAWMVGQLTFNFDGLARRWHVENDREQHLSLGTFLRAFADKFVSGTYRARLQTTLEELTLDSCGDNLETFVERHDAILQALRRVQSHEVPEDVLKQALRRGLSSHPDVEDRLVGVYQEAAGDEPFEVLSYQQILRAMKTYCPGRARRRRRDKVAGRRVIAALEASVPDGPEHFPVDFDDTLHVCAITAQSVSAEGGTFLFDCRQCQKNFHAYVTPTVPCTIECTKCKRSFKVNGRRLLENAGGALSAANNQVGGEPPNAGRPADTKTASSRPAYRKIQEMRKLALNAILTQDDGAAAKAALQAIVEGSLEAEEELSGNDSL